MTKTKVLMNLGTYCGGALICIAIAGTTSASGTAVHPNLPAACGSTTDAGSTSPDGHLSSLAQGSCQTVANRTIYSEVYVDISGSDRQVGPGANEPGAFLNYSKNYVTCDGGRTEKVYGESYWGGYQSQNSQSPHTVQHTCT